MAQLLADVSYEHLIAGLLLYAALFLLAMAGVAALTSVTGHWLAGTVALLAVLILGLSTVGLLRHVGPLWGSLLRLTITAAVAIMVFARPRPGSPWEHARWSRVGQIAALIGLLIFAYTSIGHALGSHAVSTSAHREVPLTVEEPVVAYRVDVSGDLPWWGSVGNFLASTLPWDVVETTVQSVEPCDGCIASYQVVHELRGAPPDEPISGRYGLRARGPRITSAGLSADDVRLITTEVPVPEAG